MAAIGSVWETGSWADDVWADDTWADADEGDAFLKRTKDVCFIIIAEEEECR